MSSTDLRFFVTYFVSQVAAGCAEAAARGEVHIARRLELLHAQAQARLGHLSSAEQLAAKLLGEATRDHCRGGALDFAYMCCVVAGLQRDLAIGAKSARGAAQFLAEVQTLLDAGSSALAKRARAAGFMGVSPLTFMDKGGIGEGCGLGPDGAHLEVSTKEEAAGAEGAKTAGAEGAGSEIKSGTNASSSAAVAGAGGPPIVSNIMGSDLTPPLFDALLYGAANATAAEESRTGAGTGEKALPLPFGASVLADADDNWAPTPLANL
jgi:hypothetical protein